MRIKFIHTFIILLLIAIFAQLVPSAYAKCEAVDSIDLINQTSDSTEGQEDASGKNKTGLEKKPEQAPDPIVPTGISLECPDDVLYVKDPVQLIVKITPDNADQSLEWISGDEDVAIVDANGLVTGIKEGSVNITARSLCAPTIEAIIIVEVVDPRRPKSISANTDSIELIVGRTEQLNVQVYPETASQSLKWLSSDESVATVDKDGLITAFNTGSAIITVSSTKVKAVKWDVRVDVIDPPAPESLEIVTKPKTITKGDSITLKITPYPEYHSKSVTWESSDTSVADVSSKGVVSAKSEGNVTIIATSTLNTDIQAKIKLAVFDPEMPTHIEISVSESLVLDLLQTCSLSAAVYPAEAPQDVKWSSNRPEVASVSSSGVITAKTNGSATITATHALQPSITASINVTIVASPVPESIQVAAAANELIIGGEFIIDVATVPENASKVFMYASSNVNVATVDGMGVVRGIGVGTAQITVASRRNASATVKFTVNVYEDPAVLCMLLLDYADLTLGVDDSITLKPTLVPASAQTVLKWSSSNTSVATVSSNGKVKAVGPGQEKITCSTDDGRFSATVTITVLQTTLTTVLPKVTTDIDGISGNLAKIEAIRRSAINEIIRLQLSSAISAEESTARQAIINRAFDMYAFPWMTEKLEKYYDPSIKDKDYYPGVVYYGLQYIQHGDKNAGSNRQYDKNKAVNEGFFKSTGMGYYLRDTEKVHNGKYVGNDCSAFVGICQFGMNGGFKAFSSSAIMARASYFKTIGNWGDLRPGDILVKSGKHTAMFLYHVDSAKSHMMIIHQGGLSNTVECLINISYFKSTGYIARRQVGFD